jgi:AcrR family transcriptional regulator
MVAPDALSANAHARWGLAGGHVELQLRPHHRTLQPVAFKLGDSLALVRNDHSEPPGDLGGKIYGFPGPNTAEELARNGRGCCLEDHRAHRRWSDRGFLRAGGICRQTKRCDQGEQCTIAEDLYFYSIYPNFQLNVATRPFGRRFEDWGHKTMVETGIVQGSERRSEILMRATDAFVTHGYSGTSMADLARAIGIQKASLYHHFPSKEALFIACVTEGFDGAVRRLEALRSDDTLSDPDRIRAAMEEIYRINLTTPVGRMSPLIAEVAPTIPEVAQTFHNGFIARHYATVTGMIEDGIAHGSFAAVDPLGMQHLIFGPVITLALSREMTASFPNRDDLYPVDRIRETHIDLILKLLLGPESSDGR